MYLGSYKIDSYKTIKKYLVYPENYDLVTYNGHSYANKIKQNDLGFLY